MLLGDEPVGGIAHHRRDWQGEPVYETGWNVLPPYQGRGIAAAWGSPCAAPASSSDPRGSGTMLRGNDWRLEL
ncbi:hypothetical protein [Actinacidiphila sp. bgisy160]|uniref:hypothetical protein n=1 Tax=Actinacidiphila sp. bgisy160 TaxID=3413796 RepID=UPI003D720BBE